MEKLKRFITKNFELTFVLVLIASIAAINFFIIQKIAFLNFYFLPIIVSGYYLGQRKTIINAIFCISYIVLYDIIYPGRLQVVSEHNDIVIYIFTWACFLILSGAVVGKLQEKLRAETTTTVQLNNELSEKKDELEQINNHLKDHMLNLEQEVKKRTAELEESRDMLEIMKSKVENALYSTMDATVAKLIIEGRLRDEKRKISVMFTDLSGFTSYSESRQPEIVTRDLNRYFQEMEQILFAYHAHIDKYQGDGIMCEFGTPLDFVHHRLMAVVCAIKMQEKMTAKNHPWKMRIGIASGMAIAGLIGAKRQAYTTIGDVVNIASRFEKACPAGSILIDSNTMEGVRPFVDVKLKLDIVISDSLVNRAKTKLSELNDLLLSPHDSHVEADLYYQIGQLHLTILNYEEAASHFEKALQLKPEDTNSKIAFAEAMLQKENYGKIHVKGKSRRVAAYEVIGLKDVLQDKEKITPFFYDKYRHVANLIEIPDDVILPSEVLDGCIGHSKVVAVLSYAIAEHLGIESELKKKIILQAGFLADIGLEAIPNYLLNRSKGGLSSSEYKEFLRHSIESTRILRKNGYEEPQLLSIIYHSHEKYDGTGFPARLKGQDIPIGSRIIAVADMYDSLTSWYISREKWDMKAAFDELRRSVEQGDFDPNIVDALLAVLGEASLN